MKDGRGHEESEEEEKDGRVSHRLARTVFSLIIHPEHVCVGGPSVLTRIVKPEIAYIVGTTRKNA